MSPCRMTCGLLLAALASGLGLPAVSRAEPKAEDLQRQLADLQRQVEQLKAEREARSGPTARDVDATVDAVLKDADTRSQLFAESGGITAGWQDDRFFIGSADGKFVMSPYIQFVFRSVSNLREDTSGDDHTTDNGFEVRRLKLGFDGNLWGPDLKYRFLWATDRKTGDLVLEEGFAMYRIGNLGLPEPVSVQFGQFKNYFGHEQMASSRKLFAADRSLANDVFLNGDNFVQGIGLLYNEGSRGGPLKAYFAFHDGNNEANRNFQDFPTNKWDYGGAARVEYKAMGDWKHYEDFTARKVDKSLLVFGMGLDYSEAGDFSQFLHTVDVQFKTGPVALYGAFIGRSLHNAGVGGKGTGTEDPAGAGTASAYDYGLHAKAGYMLTEDWEVFGQYSYIHFTGEEFPSAASEACNLHEITTGVNWYVRGHNAKFTADFSWFPNGTAVSNDGGGVLSQSNGRNEFMLRVQFQLLL